MPGFFSDLWQHLANLTTAWQGRRYSREELMQAIELVVKASGGFVRAERHYQRKLRPVVREILRRAKREMSQVPGPVLASRSTYDTDPVVGAVFKDADELESVLGSNASLKRYFAENQAPTACAMLTMTRRVKTVLWTEVQGQMLRRDIPRQAVSFDLHRILAPAADEQATRTELVHIYLKYLAHQSLEGYLSGGTKDEDIKSLLVLADVKLKSLKARRQSQRAAGQPIVDLNLEIREAGEKKRELEQEMDQARDHQHAMGGHLAVLLSFLSNPAQELEVGMVCERLNKFGLRVEDQAQEEYHEVCLAEMAAMAGEVKRHGVLITLRRAEFV